MLQVHSCTPPPPIVDLGIVGLEQQPNYHPEGGLAALQAGFLQGPPIYPQFPLHSGG